MLRPHSFVAVLHPGLCLFVSSLHVFPVCVCVSSYVFVYKSEWCLTCPGCFPCPLPLCAGDGTSRPLPHYCGWSDGWMKQNTCSTDFTRLFWLASEGSSFSWKCRSTCWTQNTKHRKRERAKDLFLWRAELLLLSVQPEYDRQIVQFKQALEYLSRMIVSAFTGGLEASV